MFTFVSNKQTFPKIHFAITRHHLFLELCNLIIIQTAKRLELGSSLLISNILLFTH